MNTSRRVSSATLKLVWNVESENVHRTTDRRFLIRFVPQKSLWELGELAAGSGGDAGEVYTHRAYATKLYATKLLAEGFAEMVA